MATTDALRSRIEGLLADARARDRARASERETGMEAVEARLRRFEALARRWTQEIVLPRLATLAGLFPNARPATASSSGHRVELVLEHCEEYPVEGRIDVVLEPGPERGRARVRFHPSIIPILMDYEGQAAAEFELEAPDQARLEQFLDERILRFVADYLRVRDPSSAYQRDRLVTDPVCGMTLRRAEAAGRCEHEGRTYYFCAASCRERFAADPGRYAPVATR